MDVPFWPVAPRIATFMLGRLMKGEENAFKNIWEESCVP